MNKLISKIKQIIYFAAQEAMLIVKDPGVILIFFVAPLLYPAIYSSVYHKEAIKELNIAVIDQDNSQTSRRLINMLDANTDLKVAHRISDFKQAETLFLNHEIAGIVTIDGDFERDILRGKQATMGVYADGSYLMHYKMVMTAATQVGLTFGAGVQAQKLMMRGTPQSQLMAQISPVNLVSKPLYNASGGYGTYLMPAIVTLVIQQLLLIGVGMIGGTHREANQGRYVLSQTILSRGWDAWFLGRALSYFVIFMLVAFYLYVGIFKWFAFPIHGNPADVFLLMVPYVLASVFLAMWLSSFFTFRVQSMMVLLFSSFVLLFLSGISWPFEAFPPVFKWLAMLIPSTLGIQAIMKLQIYGADLSAAHTEIYGLWTMAVVFYGAAAWRFYLIKKRQIASENS